MFDKNLHCNYNGYNRRKQMKQNEQFSVAVHSLLYLAHEKDNYCSSTSIAESVNTNAVVIRRILSDLQNAGLVQIKRGSAGAKLLKSANKITLYDVYKAVGLQSNIGLHKTVNTTCPIGAKINGYLQGVLQELDQNTKDTLNNTTIAQILQELS